MNNQKFKKTIEEYSELFFYITISVLFIFFSFLFLGYDFKLGFSNDHTFQMNQIYSEYIRIIQKSLEAKTPIFYSWNSYLGGNFYAAKAYYCTGDLLVIIAALIFKNLKATSFLLFESIFCIYLSAILINIYLKLINIDKKHVRIIFSLIYSLGGCTLIYLQYPMFLRFYAVLPLLFIGVEIYLQYNKLFLFSLSVTLLLLQNYYLMVPTTLFLPIYFLLRSNVLDGDIKFNPYKYLSNSLKLILSYVIGLAVSAVLILPAFNFITASDRLSYNEINNLLFWPFKTILSFIYYTIIPMHTTFVDQPFSVYLNTENPGVTNYFSLYIGSIGLIGLISFFTNKEEKKVAYILTLVILLLANLFLPICSLLHLGTTPTLRFTFILFFYIFTLSAKGLNDYKQKTDTYVKYTVIFIFVITILLFLIKSLEFDFNLFIVILFVLIVILFELKLLNKQKLLTVLVLVELTIYGTYYVSLHPFEKYNDDLNESSFNYYVEQDGDKLFRIAIPSDEIAPNGATNINLNYPLTYNYMGLSAYDTTYEYSLEQFIDISGSKFANNIIDSNNEDLYQLLGVKYIAVNPSKDVNESEYDFVYKLGNLNVYKLKDYNHLGHTYSSFTKDKKTNNWNDVLIVDDELYKLTNDIKKSEKQQLIIDEQVSDNNFIGHIDLPSKQVLLISIPYDLGWKIKDNGGYIKTYSVDGGLTGLILESGYHEIEAWYQPQGFKTGFILTSIGIIGYMLLIAIDRKISKK